MLRTNGTGVTRTWIASAVLLAGTVSGVAVAQPFTGDIAAFGGNFDGQTNVPAPNEDFVAIAAGWFHSLGVKDHGSIVGWGYNADG